MDVSTISQRASQHSIPLSDSSPEVRPASPLVTGKSTKNLKKKRRSSVRRMSLEQSLHIANYEATKPNTSTVVELDEESEQSELKTPETKQHESGLELTKRSLFFHFFKFVLA